jgi:hypothetical protein
MNVNPSLPSEVWVLSPDMHESAAVNELEVGQKRGGIQFALAAAVLAPRPPLTVSPRRTSR